MINDVLERVIDLKRTAKELEKIALTLKRKLDKETENVIDTDKEESKTPPASDLFKCDFCSLAFKNIPNLEKHIKEIHKEHQTYECLHCGKHFVTR